MLFDFWKALPQQHCVHPQDRPILEAHPGIFELWIPPGHVNGQFKTASVVACFLNPGFEEEDRTWFEDARRREMLFRQIQGEDDFPLWFPRWAKWYSKRVWFDRKMKPEHLAKTVAIFNVCAYASKDAKKIGNVVNKLPSSEVARCYLREVLIPQAQRGERFLVIARGAKAWGLGDYIPDCANIRFAYPRGGYFGPKIRDAIYKWVEGRLHESPPPIREPQT
jgi:hypothetical protein